jgi:NTE family protein
MPTSSPEIVKRLEQITFNSSLARDMEALAAMKKFSGPDGNGSALSRKVQDFHLHHIAAEAEFPALSQSSGLNLDWEFLLELHSFGRRAADQWLES